jgi:hypothetical protein
MIAIGTRADTTNALPIPMYHGATMQVIVHRTSEADGDQTERLASPGPRRRSTSGGDEAAAMEPSSSFQASDFSEQPGTDASQGHFAATIPRPRVWRHDAGRPWDRRSQGRRHAETPMRQEVEFRLKRAGSDRPTGGNGTGHLCSKAAA